MGPFGEPLPAPMARRRGPEWERRARAPRPERWRPQGASARPGRLVHPARGRRGAAGSAAPRTSASCRCQTAARGALAQPLGTSNEPVSGQRSGFLKPDGSKWEEPQAWPGGRLAVYRVNRLRAALMDGRRTHSASPAPEPALWESQCWGREADLPELPWPGSSSSSPAAALRPGLDRVRVEAPEE